ncbi:LPS assembly protein LptD [Lawsonia intracellularis]|uniref:LPS-assembly protein LptD n=1 Tax=Lawsonia intracellularis TaxID=29546 RepID=UPI001CBB8C03|nr:LPS assembly protein LptD [Lawsonia intracellularis]MBZ3893159.1 LPS assembly protein LptD [Lawsonia intracellularis]
MYNLFLPFILTNLIYYIIIPSLFIAFFPLQALSIINISEFAQPDINQSQTKWNLEADTLTTLSNNTIIEAKGNIILTKGQDVFKADFARYYQKTGWLFLKGHVTVKMDENEINADEAEFNLNTKTGWLNNGNIFISSSHVYFSGARITKHYGDYYTFNNVKVTTCDGPHPAWSISAKEAIVEVDGYAQLYDSTFKIKNIDVMYSPIFTIPAKQTRQSGFLNPNYGISQRRGIYYTQPYFLNIDQSSDLTFYAGLMTKIGPLGTVRYRSHKFTNQKTWFAASGIHDKNNIVTPGKDPVYPSSQLVRNNHQRYWVRGMADGFIGNSTWCYISNLDYVSDQDYLREFDQGITGFSHSRSEMFQMFGRDIQEDDQSRLNALLIRKDWQRIGVVGNIRYEQDPTLGHGNHPTSQSELTQRIPQIDMFLYQGKLFQPLSLEGAIHLQSAYMYRAKGTKGWRTELYPKVTLPIDLKYGSVITTVGLRETYYQTGIKSHTSPVAPHVPDTKTPRQTGQHRSLFNLQLESSTQAHRIWRLKDKKTINLHSQSIGKTFCTALKHTIQPRICYSFIPREGQEKNPFYTLSDRILPQNDLTYSIVNILTKKNVTISVDNNNNNNNDNSVTPTLITSYYDLLYWNLSTGYDFEEERRKQYVEKYPKRPIKDIYSELELYILSWLTYSGKTFISPYNGNITRHDHNIIFKSDRFSWKTGLSFRDQYYNYREHLQYRDENNIIMSSRLRLLQNSFSIQLLPNVSVTLEDFRNLRERGTFGKTNSQLVEVTYLAQCYRIIGRYRYDGYDRSYTVLIEIPGLFE